MSTFLAFIAKKSQDAAKTFITDVETAQSVKRRSVDVRRVNAALGMAAFKRMDGSGSVFTEDANGNWLLIAGTCIPASEKLRDPAFLLASALDDPYKLARELDGFFALLVGETGPNPKLHVITDPHGSFHVYSRAVDSGVFVSSSSLVLAATRPVSIDPVAAQEFIATGVIYEERSLYSGVRKLPPATVHEYAQDSYRAKNYWSPFEARTERESMLESADRLWEALTAAAKSVTGIASSPICDLTGGYDSRILNAVCKHAGMAFTTTVSGGESDPDVLISRRLAQVLDVPHSYTPPVPQEPHSIDEAVRLGDGELDATEYARVYEVHKRHTSGFDFSFNGSYGEVARGYWWELLDGDPSVIRPLDIDRVAGARFVGLTSSSGLFLKDNRIDLRSHFSGVLRRTLESQEDRSLASQMDMAYISIRMQRWQGRIASATDQVRPCLSPLGLRRVLDVVLSIPPTHRRRSRVVRHMLDRHANRVANVPLEHGYPAVPFKIRNSHRFAPLLGYYASRVAARVLPRRAGLGSGVQTRLANNRPGDIVAIPIFDEAALTRFFSNENGSRDDYGVMCRLRTIEGVHQLLSRSSID